MLSALLSAVMRRALSPAKLVSLTVPPSTPNWPVKSWTMSVGAPIIAAMSAGSPAMIRAGSVGMLLLSRSMFGSELSIAWSDHPA